MIEDKQLLKKLEQKLQAVPIDRWRRTWNEEKGQDVYVLQDERYKYIIINQYTSDSPYELQVLKREEKIFFTYDFEFGLVYRLYRDIIDQEIKKKWQEFEQQEEKCKRIGCD